MGRLLATCLLASLILAATPPGLACPGPGFPFSVEGTATMQPTGDVYAARLTSGPASVKDLGTTVFRLTLTDPHTGFELPPVYLQGDEAIDALVISEIDSCAFLESAVGYRAMDRATGGSVFLFEGPWQDCLAGERAGERFMRITGHALLWDLVLGWGEPFA